jgi:hypothetical protein
MQMVRRTLEREACPGLIRGFLRAFYSLFYYGYPDEHSMVPPNAHRDAHPEIHYWHALHKAEQMKTKGGADAEWIFKILASTGALGMEYGYSYSK